MSITRPVSAVVLLILMGGCGQPATELEPQAVGDALADETSARPAAAALSTAGEPASQEDAADSLNPGQQLLAALGENPRTPILRLAFDWDESLVASDEASEQTAAQLLAVAHQVVHDESVAAYIDGVAKDNAVAAAKLLVWVARAQLIAGEFDNAPYALGRLVVADGNFPPSDVMAQVPISTEGYFATEIGDRGRPLAFRAPGYQDLEVPLDGNANAAENGASEGDVAKAPVGIVLGDVTLQPLSADEQATLRGRVALDDAAQVGSAAVRVNLAMPQANTPHNGFSPRRSWPEPQTVKADEEGAFEMAGLSPGDYTVSISADEHAAIRQRVSLEAGEVHETGDLALRSTSLGFYVGAEEPEVPELAWEEDFDTALARAKSENRPLMVMMTATWCGPCKMLERDSLSNVWIRHFLAPFVVVQAYEEKTVEDKYGLEGYPTLVFCDSAGELVYTSVGYRPAIEFAGEVAHALKAVEAELPAELQALVDKGVVVAE